MLLVMIILLMVLIVALLVIVLVIVVIVLVARRLGILLVFLLTDSIVILVTVVIVVASRIRVIVVVTILMVVVIFLLRIVAVGQLVTLVVQRFRGGVRLSLTRACLRSNHVRGVFVGVIEVIVDFVHDIIHLPVLFDLLIDLNKGGFGLVSGGSLERIVASWTGWSLHVKESFAFSWCWLIEPGLHRSLLSCFFLLVCDDHDLFFFFI